jgi:hypothetical protein
MQNSYQAPVLNNGYYDVPIQNAYSNPNMMNNNYQQVPQQQFNPMIQNSYPHDGYVVQPSNLETFVGSRESSYKYISNNGYNTNPYVMSINHSNDQFPAQVYTNTGVQLRVDPRMSSSKIEDSAYKAKSQMMGGGYAQQFMPNNPFTIPQYGMNYNNPSNGMGMWSFEPPYSEPNVPFPAVPAFVSQPPVMMMSNQQQQMMMPNQQQMMMMQPQQRPTPNIRIRDNDVSEAGDDSGDDDKKSTSIKALKREKKNKSLLEKFNDLITDNSTIYWLVVLLFVLVISFVVKSLYVNK